MVVARRSETKRLSDRELQLLQHYASTAWGEAEWVAVLKADNHLYFSLLRGIGRAGYLPDNPDRLRAAAIPAIPLPCAARSDCPRAPASSPVPSG